MQYKDFIIDYELISGLNHRNVFADRIETEGRMCHVYGADDHEMKYELTKFPLVEGIDYNKDDEQSFEDTLRQTIDLNEYGIRLYQRCIALHQKVSTMTKLIIALLTPVPESEWYEIMINQAGLTAHELHEIGIEIPPATDN